MVECGMCHISRVEERMRAPLMVRAAWLTRIHHKYRGTIMQTREDWEFVCRASGHKEPAHVPSSVQMLIQMLCNVLDKTSAAATTRRSTFPSPTSSSHNPCTQYHNYDNITSSSYRMGRGEFSFLVSSHALGTSPQRGFSNVSQ